MKPLPKTGRAKKPETFRMRIRISVGKRMLGPGKAELLAWINATGSLRAAAHEMGMSYMRAWTLVQELNSDQRSPMVELSRGGSGGGGTGRLTPQGQKVLDLYQKMESAGARAARPFGQKLARLLE